jgi:hypothetical protein
MLLAVFNFINLGVRRMFPNEVVNDGAAPVEQNVAAATKANAIANLHSRVSRSVMTKKAGRCFLATLMAIFALALFAKRGLASDVNSSKATLPSEQTSQLIQRLDATKKADWEAALDPSVSPVREETFLNQMNKADRASRELSHGFSVPQTEINDALWAPPKHISPEERAHLIRELNQARQEDEQNEQNMLNDLAWGHSAAPADTSIFDQRKQEVDAVVKDLEIGTPVHWTTIKQALVALKSPY